MTIVRCPRCRDEVTVPAGATGRALVRCPLCLDEYLLSEALADAPPPLVIIGGEVPDEIIEKHPPGGTEYRLATDYAGAAFGTNAAAAPAVALARPALRGALRPRPKQSSGLAVLVNYAVGGVLGLTLGLLVLWWGFRRDPLELGPSVAEYAPWVVPRAFRGSARPALNGAAAAESGDSAATDSQASEERHEAPAPASVPRTHHKARASARSAVKLDAAEGDLQTLPTLDAPASPAIVPPTIEAPVLDKEPPGPALGTAPDPRAAGDVPKGEPAPPPPDLSDLFDHWPPAGLRPVAAAKPPVTSGDFVSAVEAAQAALQAYEKSPQDDSAARQQAFTELWLATGEAGRVLSYLDPADAGVADSLEVLETVLLALRGARRNAVSHLTLQHWPDLANQRGLLLTGKVESIVAAGNLYKISIVGTDRAAPFTVALVSAHDPRDLWSIGDELIAVGRIVDEPGKHLPGYAGDQPRVVMMGFSVKAP